MFSTPSDDQHSRMRKALSPVFSEKAVREREETMQQYIDAWRKKLNGFEGQAFDILKWYEMLLTDLTGHFAFGESFHCM
jgi:cytochrome P450